MRVTRAGIVCAAMATILGGGVVEASYGQDSSSATAAQSAAIFKQLAPVLQHPRCINCHPAGDIPLQGDDSHPHIMGIERGPDGKGVAALPCGSCHQEHNSPAGVPGAHDWHLAPSVMAWEGLTAGEICRSMLDPKRGNKTPAEMVKHMDTDQVKWAWDGSPDLNGKPRQAPPIPYPEFLDLVKRWVDTGAVCPP